MLTLATSPPPAVQALLLQVVALGGVFLFTHFTALHLSSLQFALLGGLLAVACTYIAGLAIWWLPIQLLFAPALVLTLSLRLPSSYFLIAFIMLLVVYWSVFRTQVPLYLSSRKIWLALEGILPPAGSDKDFRFLDIGSGLAGVLTHLARTRPDGQFHGVETAPLPFLLSWLRIRLGKQHNCQVHWGSLWACDLKDYDVVYAYLSPAPMEHLWLKAKSEMRPGSLFISNTFAVPDHPPQQTFTTDDLHRSKLHIWHM